jgi:iron complex transport system ATP-binding protein
MFTLDDRPLKETPNSQFPPSNTQFAALNSQLSAPNAQPLRLFGRATWDVEELRRRLGVVTGDLDIGFGAGTSRGRVIGLDVTLSGLFGSQGVFSHHSDTAAMREQAHHALRRVEAAHLAGRPLNRMSTGERRRVLIARALVTDPDVLVLDEPATGLDLVARHRFMESVARLAEQGTTVILVTHHVEEIIPATRKVVLLQQGRVAFDGPPEAGLTSARLSDLFGAPVVVGQSGGYFHVRMQMAHADHARAAGC